MAEILEVLQPDGTPTGQALDKAIIHDQELWHRDTHVWISDGQNLLQQQRQFDKSIMPGEWDVSVGGHVTCGETDMDAALRETAEELGLPLTADQLTYIGSLGVDLAMDVNSRHHRTVGSHFAVVKPGLRLDDITVQDSEVAAVRWYPIDQLEADLAAPETAGRHASQPRELWKLGIDGLRRVIANT